VAKGNSSKILSTFSGAEYKVPKERADKVDRMIKRLHATSVGSLVGLIVTVPLVYFTDFELLVGKILQSFTLIIGLMLPAWFITLVTVFVVFFAQIQMYLGFYKWLIRFMQILPAVFYCSSLISVTTKRRLTLKAKLSIYQSIQIFAGLVNVNFSFLLITFKFMMIFGNSIGLTICLIYKFSPLSFTLLIVSTSWIGFVNFAFSFASAVFESSRKFIQHLQLHPQARMGRKFPIHRTICSLRECRIYCGSQYFIDRSILFKIYHAIFNYTISNVLMFKKIHS